MNTLMCTHKPGHLITGALVVSNAARVAGEKSARDRRAFTWGVERVQAFQVPAYEPATIPTLHVAPSAQGRST